MKFVSKLTELVNSSSREDYAKVELTKKPNWLDDFRSKYDEPYEYHVTLKQPCVIEEDLIPEIKAKLNTFFWRHCSPELYPTI